MTIRPVVLLLAICSAASASLFGIPNFSLFTQPSSLVDTQCALFSTGVKLLPLAYPEEENISFELRTSCNRTDFPVSRAHELLESIHFDINKTTVVFISGWMSYMDEDYTERLTKAYLCRGDVNFIVVNPSYHLRVEYINSAYNTEEIGRLIALGLQRSNISGSKIHLIGHSLGAHIMGSAGRNFASETTDKIGRITGLDPARPCFIQTPVFSRLKTSDAVFVDIIHTNPKETGSEEVTGHTDFFPGGLRAKQPGCAELDVKCSHIMSIEYYTETVYKGNENNFLATHCDSYAQLEQRTCSGNKASMGYAAADTNALGIYILDVNEVPPYGKNASSSEYLKQDKCGVCAQ